MAATIAVYSTHPWMEEGGQKHELRHVDAIPRVIAAQFMDLKPAPSISLF